jgi:hypothetical protein
MLQTLGRNLRSRSRIPRRGPPDDVPSDFMIAVLCALPGTVVWTRDFEIKVGFARPTWFELQWRHTAIDTANAQVILNTIKTTLFYVFGTSARCNIADFLE